MARFKCERLVQGLDGTPISSADVSVYLDGTTTAATVYLTKDAGSGVSTVPQTTTNDVGVFVFWVDDKDYDYRQRFRIEVIKNNNVITATGVQIVGQNVVIDRMIKEPTVLDIAEDANLLDGYDTSATPEASKIPIADANGTLDGWVKAVVLGGTSGSGKIIFNASSGDYGQTWGNYTPPTVTGPAIVIARNTNGTGAGTRLYVYDGAAWKYVELT